MESRISAIDVWTVRVPLSPPVYLGDALIREREFAVARVRTAGGTEGWGTTFTRGLPVEATAVNVLAPLLSGEDALAVRHLGRKFVRAAAFCGNHGAFARALSILDIALWDIKAKSAGLPLYRLLGGERRRLPVLVPAGYRFHRDVSEEELERELTHYRDEGVEAVKLMFPPNLLRARPSLLLLARRVLGERVLLGNDFLSQAENAPALLDVLAAVREARLDFVEDPFPVSRERAFSDLSTHWPGRIFAGELCVNTDEARNILALQGLHGVRWDATVCGGITGWLKAFSLAEAGDLPVLPHCAPEVHAHLVSATGQKHVETTMPRYDTIGSSVLFGQPLPIQGGFYKIPDEPGIGISLDPKALGQYRV